MFFRTVPSANTLVRWVNENAFVSEVQTRPCPTFGRPVHLGSSPSITARYFSSCPSDSILRWTPCPPEYSKRWLQVGLGCIQLSPSCPFRRLHTFHFLRPARLRTPLLGYGAPHLSARGTSTLLNNALLSAHFRLADHSRRPLDIISDAWIPPTNGSWYRGLDANAAHVPTSTAR